jgi:hypothetical protein
MSGRILVFVVISVILILSSCSMIDTYTGEGDNRPVRETGMPASAEVLEVWDTGVRYNNNPVVGFRLLVTLADGTTYEAETKNVVSVVHIPQVQPGAVLPVKTDPDDRERVALDIYEERE